MIKSKTIVFTSAMLIFIQPVIACDICGCGNNGNYIGILPEFQQHIIGVRYRQNGIQSHVGNNGSITYLTTRESYSSYELWGSIKVAKKTNLLFSLPYNINTENSASNRQTISGLGDINLLGYYALLQSNQLTKSNKVFIQSWRIAGGVKLPTGKFSLGNQIGQAQLFTLGTGTIDFLFGTMYEGRLQNTGINLSTNVKLNTKNTAGYLYGHKSQTNMQLYQKLVFDEKISLAPNIGLQYEYSQKDKFNDQYVDISGGKLLNANYGAEFQFNKYFIGMNLQIPMSQSIGKGMIQANQRWMLHFSHAF